MLLHSPAGRRRRACVDGVSPSQPSLTARSRHGVHMPRSTASSLLALPSGASHRWPDDYKDGSWHCQSLLNPPPSLAASSSSTASLSMSKPHERRCCCPRDLAVDPGIGIPSAGCSLCLSTDSAILGECPDLDGLISSCPSPSSAPSKSCTCLAGCLLLPLSHR